jgi:two-component sensor histidine kinase/DNA-binding NarL/FixJ family response regulator
MSATHEIIETSQAKERLPRPEETAGASAVPAEPKVNILLVDDRPANLLATAVTLEELGQHVVKARSGQEALRSVLAEDFAVILLDVQMPGLDGFETARLIRTRKRSRHTPIIFLTAYESTDVQVFKAYALGAVDYLFKPVVAEVLRSKVAVFVELFQKTEQVKRQAEQLQALRQREYANKLAEERQRWEMALLRAEREKDRQITEALTHRAEELARVITERQHAEEQLKASLQDKEVLLREIHHRVKNNLQIISSLLALQSESITDRQALELFRESRNRVQSMARIHEKMYRSRDLVRIDFGEYIRSLASDLFRTYRVPGSAVQLDIDVTDVFLGIDTAIPCALILNELIANSLKYAFPPGRHGTIRVALHRDPDGRLVLTVSDDGVGFPGTLDFRTTRSLGLQIVTTLTKQLDGTIDLLDRTGTTFQLTFTELHYRERGVKP